MTVAFTTWKEGDVKNKKGNPPTIYLYNVESQKEIYKIKGAFSILKYDHATNEVMYLTHLNWYNK